MILLIQPWHGEDPDLVAKIEALGAHKIGSHPVVSYWELESSLDEFALKWGEHFMVRPSNDPEMYFVHVTQFGGFGQR